MHVSVSLLALLHGSAAWCVADCAEHGDEARYSTLQYSGHLYLLIRPLPSSRMDEGCRLEIIGPQRFYLKPP